MSTSHDLPELYDELDALASRAPVHQPPPAGSGGQELWERGRRYRRQQAIGHGIVSAAVITLVAVLGTSWLSYQPQELRPAGSIAGLPDTVWSPSPYLRGTDETGPLGRLAIVLTEERKGWFGSEMRPLGISAETGEYAFLDLPRWTAEALTERALSPDGYSVAYWVTGTPSGSPRAEGDTITGIAVYDTRTGDVRVTEIPTEHGLSAESLAFSDNETVVAQTLQYVGGEGDSSMDQSSAIDPTWWVWRLEEDEAERAELGIDSADGAGHGNVWTPSTGRSGIVTVVDVRAGTQIDSLSIRSAGTSRASAVDPTGMRVATPSGNGNPRSVKLSGSEADSARVIEGTEQTYVVIAWLDERRILLNQRDRSLGSGVDQPGLTVADVRTGEVQQLVSPAGDFEQVDDVGPILNRYPSVAWELADADTFTAPAPPEPIGPWSTLGRAFWLLVLFGGGFLLWRRGAQP